MFSQDCIASFTQGFFYVPRNDVISRAAEVPLQVANTFPPPFHGYPPSAAVNKCCKVWSWPGAGLPCWRGVTYFSPNHLSLTVIIVFLLVKKHNFQTSTNHCGIKRCFSRSACKALAVRLLSLLFLLVVRGFWYLLAKRCSANTHILQNAVPKRTGVGYSFTVLTAHHYASNDLDWSLVIWASLFQNIWYVSLRITGCCGAIWA